METNIREKVLALGYEDCGIIRVGALAGYRDRLEERIAKIPMGEQIYGYLRGYADPSATYPGIKSIIVAIVPTYRYKVPSEFAGVYGKAYLFDNRTDAAAPFFKKREEFKSYLEGEGVACITGGSFGLQAPARWAAYQAGLGIIRRNNFFYTQNGSYNYIEMFAIDRELELIRDVRPRECAANCSRCMDACPTCTLSSPYTMSMAGCISFQTNLSAKRGMGVPSSEMVEQIGDRMFGCDVCQDVCPFNQGKWVGDEVFPGLEALVPSMRPETIMAASYDEIGRTLAPKYWYIPSENLWKWKLNALTVMMNGYAKKYEASIKLGLVDPDEKVRDFAFRACAKLGISC